MTLLELLVKELPKHGGWPEGANFIACDKDGQVDSYRYIPVPDSTGLNWICSSGEGFLSSCIVPACTCSDWDSSIVTREQYEAAIVAQQPAWNGEGLPPVGVECEILWNDDWVKCVVKAYGEEQIIFKAEGSREWAGHINNYKFRPIRSPEDVARDEAIEIMKNMYSIFGPSNVGMDNAIRHIYDAIADGKIPGVEISK